MEHLNGQADQLVTSRKTKGRGGESDRTSSGRTVCYPLLSKISGIGLQWGINFFYFGTNDADDGRREMREIVLVDVDFLDAIVLTPNGVCKLRLVVGCSI